MSEDYMRLTGLSVEGPSELKVGDSVTVKFSLQNYGQNTVKLGVRGIYAHAKDPDSLDTSFGFSYANTLFEAGKIVSVSASRKLDKAGSWVVWPSYHILSGKEYKSGPENWQACYLKVGAAPEPDNDKDGVPDASDNCLNKYNPKQEDFDQDSIGDHCDNCPQNYNPKQADSDKDGVGDACEKPEDSDRDGVDDSIDNCVNVYNPRQENGDKDAFGDACDDSDKDGAMDDKDNCIFVYNQDQKDSDKDGIGDSCDECDDRDSDGDSIKNCEDKCTHEMETLNGFEDSDGCPDQAPLVTATPSYVDVQVGRSFSIRSEDGLEITLKETGREIVREGPIMPSAFDDYDGDGVPNMADNCPRTPSGKQVFENGCVCKDSDGGIKPFEKGTVLIKGRSKTVDYCVGSLLIENYCGSGNEETETNPSRTMDCRYGCENGACKTTPVEAFPITCSTGTATCADKVRNQDEIGVDCGGKCPPCNSVCSGTVKYAPNDSPCTSHFIGGGRAIVRGTPYPHANFYKYEFISDENLSDMHKIELEWTEGGGECPCQFYEVCDQNLDHVIEEALKCCSSTSWDDVNRTVDPNLCRESLRGGGSNCKKCVGLYIIKGLGPYARWMRGYFRNSLMDYFVCGAWASAAPAERLINYHKKGICRDYSGALATLLRKAGYTQREVANYCDGAHCYNLVKFPGDAKWHVVDTTNNNIGVVLGGLPGDYPYCFALNEANYCFKNITTYDADEYWRARDAGRVFAFATCRTPGFTGRYGGIDFNFNRSYAPECGPGVACARDNFRLPDFAPSINQIVGCS
ncbi:MAG: thrombospondin type 3 repeat-containing protein [Candidatus Diapherotrites archaeon]|nr:thrombospondin type 3 repeat-containing protein [Candidatus Diapherotrites archaeon]